MGCGFWILRLCNVTAPRRFEVHRQFFGGRNHEERKCQPGALSSRISCVWDTAARHVAAIAIWHWRSWASCNLLDRSPSRSRPELVASTAPWPHRLRQFSVSAVVVFRRQRTSDQSEVAYRGWTLSHKRLRASIVPRGFRRLCRDRTLQAWAVRKGLGSVQNWCPCGPPSAL